MNYQDAFTKAKQIVKEENSPAVVYIDDGSELEQDFDACTEDKFDIFIEQGWDLRICATLN